MDKNSAIKIFIDKFLGTNDNQLAEELENIAHIVTLESKKILFAEGDKADNLYYLVSGSVKLSRMSPDGKETVLRFVSPNELFAEIILVSRDTYPVNATILEKSDLLAIDAAKMKTLYMESQAFAMKLFSIMAARVSYLVDMINGLTAEDAMGRLKKYINSLSTKHKSDTIRLPVAKGELALLLGTTPETVSRLLTKLKNDKEIAIDGRKITILKKDNLQSAVTMQPR